MSCTRPVMATGNVGAKSVQKKGCFREESADFRIKLFGKYSIVFSINTKVLDTKSSERHT